MIGLENAIKYARSHQDKFLNDLKTLIQIPSISTLPEYSSDILHAAEWLVQQLQALGFDEVEIKPTDGHPVVYGQHMEAGADVPTILVYGHYDVQPADPVDEWTSNPFDPQIRGENLYARGASDMKGQVVAFLKAIEAMIADSGLPINVKMMLEGEEEIGSPSLEKFITDHRELLACDLCLNGDVGIQAPDIPAITYALRGLAYFEIRVQGPSSDLHSGSFGGAVENPANVLCTLIAGMVDDEGRITLPGFYDQVRPISAQEREELAELPRSDAWWLQQTGVPALHGEAGYTSTERAMARPTLDVNGIVSGFTGEGSKTVLPAKAMAKVSMRLVPNQRPSEIEKGLRTYLEKHAPLTVRWEIQDMASCRPALVERDTPAVQAASRSLNAVWGKSPIFIRQGGTIPVVGLIQELLGVDSLLMGFSLPDDNMHAPNEKQHLPTFYRGIETYIHFAYDIAGRKS